MTPARIVHVDLPHTSEGLGLFWFRGLPSVGDSIWIDLPDFVDDPEGVRERFILKMCRVREVVWELAKKNAYGERDNHQATLHVETHKDFYREGQMGEGD